MPKAGPLLSALFVLFLGFTTSAAPAPRAVYMGDVTPVLASQGWGQLGIDKSVQGNPLQIGDRRFARGIGTHARSEIVYDLDRSFERFEAWVGLDAEMKAYPQALATFQVIVDGKEVFDSGPVTTATPARKVSVSLVGASELELIVTDGGNGTDCDHADWADARLLQASKPVASLKAKYEVKAPGLCLKLTDRGQIAGGALGAKALRSDITGGSRLLGCRDTGEVSCRRLPGGGFEFTREMTRFASDQRCKVIERFTPAKNSIRWDLEIQGSGTPWSTPVSFHLRWPTPATARFWAPWDDPDQSGTGWHDPCSARPFAMRAMWIGAPPMGPGSGLVHLGGDCVSIPMATVLVNSSDVGLSLVLSPEDTYLDTSLTTSADGSITFSHINNRISSAAPVRFSADIVTHEADWRSGLGWMASRYPQYFNPGNPRAYDIAGCGAYSSYEGDLDVAKYRKMAFRVNWKASFDFPYCGMFIPPVSNDHETWPRFDADSGGNPTGASTVTSIAQLEAYSRKMRNWGFHVLNFFNVTEMGMSLRGTEPPDKKPTDADLWRNPSAFVETQLSDAIVHDEAGRTYQSWGGQIVVDPATPSYRKHILDQAKRHIDKIPSSSGICIDRMDWLRVYNPNADDGVTWRDGRPMRALTESWKLLLADMGPMMHHAGKVIYANALVKRLDLMKNVDGIYHEFGHLGINLNGTAFLCVRKPALAWTPPMGSEKDLTPDPDSYFQRHLHMGVFPTAPLPGNDHTITPSDWADKWYTDYGPLLDQMRGKKWVLEPHVLQVVGDAAKANIFEVPGGYVVPVTFGGKAQSVTIKIRPPKAISTWNKNVAIKVLHPGRDEWTELKPTLSQDALVLAIPLQSGCAMVRIDIAPARAAGCAADK